MGDPTIKPGGEASVEVGAAYRELEYTLGNGEGDAPVVFQAPEFDLGASYRLGVTKHSYTLLGLQPFVEIGGNVSLTHTTGAAEAYQPATECQNEVMGTCLDGAGGNYAGATANGNHGSVTLRAGVGTPISIFDVSAGGYVQHRIFGDSAMAPFVKDGVMVDTDGDGTGDTQGAYTGMSTMLNTPALNWDAGLYFTQDVHVVSLGRFGSLSAGATEYIPLTGNVTFQVTEANDDGSIELDNHDSPTRGFAVGGHVTLTFGGAGRTDLVDVIGGWIHGGGDKRSKSKDVPPPEPVLPASTTTSSRVVSGVEVSKYDGMGEADKITAIQADPAFQALMTKAGITGLSYAAATESDPATVLASTTDGKTYELGSTTTPENAEATQVIQALLGAPTAIAAPIETQAPKAKTKKEHGDKPNAWDTITPWKTEWEKAHPRKKA